MLFSGRRLHRLHFEANRIVAGLFRPISLGLAGSSRSARALYSKKRMLDEKEWFQGLKAVPGVGYLGSKRIDLSRLWGVNATPLRSSTPGLTMWRSQDGGETSASPADQYKAQTWDGASNELLLRLETILELPGYASSYHFAIQGCSESLWGRRLAEPELLGRIESLYWLDIRLIQAKPDPFRIDSPERPFVSMSAFRRLCILYQREGFFHEALSVAELAFRFGQGEDLLKQVTASRAIELQEPIS